MFRIEGDLPNKITSIFGESIFGMTGKKNVKPLNLQFHLKLRKAHKNGEIKKMSKQTQNQSCNSLSNPLPFIQLVFPFRLFLIHDSQAEENNNDEQKTMSLCCLQKKKNSHSNRERERKGTFSSAEFNTTMQRNKYIITVLNG